MVFRTLILFAAVAGLLVGTGGRCLAGVYCAAPVAVPADAEPACCGGETGKQSPHESPAKCAVMACCELPAPAAVAVASPVARPAPIGRIVVLDDRTDSRSDRPEVPPPRIVRV